MLCDLHYRYIHTHQFLSLLHIPLYISLLILDLWADGMITEDKINLTKCWYLYICTQWIAVHTCWFCLNSVRASWTMYFLSVSVSPANPVCACQVRATRNNLVYKDKTALRVEAIITATKQKLSIHRNLQETLQFKFRLFPQHPYTSLMCNYSFVVSKSRILLNSCTKFSWYIFT